MTLLFDIVSLTGHVHNNPDRKITDYGSYPNGVTIEFVNEKVAAFSKAFTILNAELRPKTT